jgi:hypothetical protein
LLLISGWSTCGSWIAPLLPLLSPYFSLLFLPFVSSFSQKNEICIWKRLSCTWHSSLVLVQLSECSDISAY